MTISSSSASMEIVDLCDITTHDGPIVHRKSFSIMSHFLGSLDGLEYSLGLRRGGFATYDNKPCTTVYLAIDMADKFGSSEWALLPSAELMKAVCELFELNHQRATKDRVHFSERLPEVDYIYQLLPPVTDKDMVIYAKGKAYPYPYNDFPLIRTTYHPCFAYPPFMSYLCEGYVDIPPNSIDSLDWAMRLMGEIPRMMSKPINLSWFDGTWGEFRSRSWIEKRPDPLPTPPPSELEADEELLTDEEQPELYLLCLREDEKMARYMKAHPYRYDEVPVPAGKSGGRGSRKSSRRNPSSSAAGSTGRRRATIPASLGGKSPSALPVASDRVTRSTSKLLVTGSNTKGKRTGKAKPPVTPPESDDESPTSSSVNWRSSSRPPKRQVPTPPVRTKSSPKSKKRQAEEGLFQAPRAKRSKCAL